MCDHIYSSTKWVALLGCDLEYHSIKSMDELYTSRYTHFKMEMPKFGLILCEEFAHQRKAEQKLNSLTPMDLSSEINDEI